MRRFRGIILFYAALGLFFGEAPRVFARDSQCGAYKPVPFLKTLFNKRDALQEEARTYVNQCIPKWNLKGFDFETYESAKLDFLASPEVLPRPDSHQMENTLAWFESLRLRSLSKSEGLAQSIRTLDELIQKGSSSEKRALRDWYRRYARNPNGITEKDIPRASLSLSLLLSGSELDLGELSRLGIQETTKKYIKTAAHSRLYSEELYSHLKLRNENALDQLRNITSSNAFKWTKLSGLNGYYLLENPNFLNALLFQLPDTSFIKIAKGDLDLFIEHGVNLDTRVPSWKDPKIEIPLSQKYERLVQNQVTFNAFRNTVALVSNLGFPSWVAWTITHHRDYQRNLHTGRRAQTTIKQTPEPNAPH